MKVLKKLPVLFILSLFLIIIGCNSQSSETVKNTEQKTEESVEESNSENIETAKKSDDNYPNKPITLIVAYGPGGTDTTARLLAEPLGKEFGQPVNVVNVTGGGGWNGWGRLADSDPDGYTIGYINVPNMFMGYLDPEIGVDKNLESFDTIMNHVTDPCVWVVKADSPFENVDGVISKLKEEPSSVSIAAHGVGSDDHIGILQVEKDKGVKLNIIQNNGTGESMSQLLGGHIDIVGANVGEVTTLVKEGEVRILGVMSEKRSPYLPDTPTFKEQGYDVISFVGRGIAVPQGTPQEIVDVISTALEKILSNPGDSYEKLGLELDSKKGEEYNKFLKENEQRIKTLMGW